MTDSNVPSSLVLTGKAYDITKEVAQTILPGLGALYFAVAQIWHLPAAVEVVGSVTAVDTFLGVLLKISKAGYTPDDPVPDNVVDLNAADPDAPA